MLKLCIVIWGYSWLLGFGAFDGKYLITRASHDINLLLDLYDKYVRERCLNGY